MPALNFDTEAPLVARRLAEPDVVLVACLCAEWCGSCRAYRAVFDTLADAHPHACFVWVDIETHADLLGDIDVENFPTIAIEDAVRTHFFGTVLPQPKIVERMLADFDALPQLAGAPKIRRLLAA